MMIPFVKRLQQIQRHREYDRRSRTGQSLDAQRMKKFIRLICMLFFTACSMHRQKLTWRVKDMALERTPAVDLQGLNEQIVLTANWRLSTLFRSW